MEREMMLPRANNKNCIKVNIDKGDDQEDIRNKLNIAKSIQEQEQGYSRPFEDKMDIEEPKPVSNSQPIYGRRTEIPQNFGGDKKTMNVKGRGNSDMNNFRGREMHDN